MKYLLVPVFLLCVGCSPRSLNLQRSALRAAGDLASTEFLDVRDAGDVPKMTADILEVAGKLETFLNDGSVADLTKGKIGEELAALIPTDYRHYADLILDRLDVDVDTGKIGANNVKRIRAIIVGIVAGARKYDVADRPED